MASSAMKKVNKISQIVRLKQVMQRWKTMSISKNAHRSIDSESDAESDFAAASRRKRSIPSGSLAVYVGHERRRFVIPTRFLNLPVFVSLLNQAEEEFGFQTSGGLVLPCEAGFFKRLLRILYRDESRFGGLALEDFVKMFADVGGSSSCLDSSTCTKDASSGSNSNSCHSFTPLLQKARV